MTTYPECAPCILRTSVEAMRRCGAPADVAWRALREALALMSRHDPQRPPIALGGEVARVVRRELGTSDPYGEAKRASNAAAFSMYLEFKRAVAGAPDPLLQALHLAAAGNSVDLGMYAHVDVGHAIAEATARPFARSDYELFRWRLEKARKVLYLADNAGEIVLDRVLIETLLERGKEVVLAVRGGPILNDATVADTHEVGLVGLVPVITTGSALPGILLDTVSSEFRDAFYGTDLVLSKGMGNFEGLWEEVAPIFFLLRAKCGPVARETEVEVGDLVFLAGRG